MGSPTGAYSLLGQLRSESDIQSTRDKFYLNRDMEIERREEQEQREDRAGLTGWLRGAGSIGAGLLATLVTGGITSPVLAGIVAGGITGAGSLAGSKAAGWMSDVDIGKFNVADDEAAEKDYKESQWAGALSDAITAGTLQGMATKAGGWKDLLGIEETGKVLDPAIDRVGEKVGTEGSKYISKPTTLESRASDIISGTKVDADIADPVFSKMADTRITESIVPTTNTLSYKPSIPDWLKDLFGESSKVVEPIKPLHELLPWTKATKIW